MKGVVFTEFLEFADQQFGTRVVETAVIDAALPSGGAYTAVGTYPIEELVAILGKLTAATGTGVPEMLGGFGQHLFRSLATRYAAMVSIYGDSFSLLEAIESVIHVEVLKLYPDAELPCFSHNRVGPNELILVYRSERGLGRLVDGLLEGCFQHYGEKVLVTRDELSGGRNTHVQFRLCRQSTAT